MESERDLMELEKQHLHQLELETQPQEEAASLPFLDDALRWKAIYLFSGTVLLAAWWLIYDNLLAFSRLITYHVLPLHEGTHLGSTVEFFIFRSSQGATAPHPHSVLRRNNSVFFYARADTKNFGRQPRVRGACFGRIARRRNTILFVFRRASVHGLSHCRSASRGHILVSRFRSQW